MKPHLYLLSLLLAGGVSSAGVEISGVAKMGSSLLVFCSVDGVEYTLSSKGQTVGPYTLVDLDMKDGIVTFSREEKTCAFKLRAGSVTQLEAEVDPENWTGWIINKTQSKIRSTCPRNDVSTVPI